MFDKLYFRIGNRIKDKRTTVGWTQAKLAEKANLDASQISRLEHGMHGELETYLKITEALQISIDELVQDVSRSAQESLYTKELLDSFHKLPSTQHKIYVLKMVQDFLEFAESK
ncbi:helix-turn-helix domain-containing protein [Ructibacterium gallinarum]|uniref:Helix-turn-helix transcriptional regulator n=1 Tax=Ructibacterium gallinarum TaxID=2779355 RepID=A0A9D5R9G8_9FIRM|nr:helix-turn-helix transcriptional regulator [Ructibacterium gallinarum]MBE5040479.1 helix-turn-helix transcriptional regulator [Ructibacterium gallinarum]